MKSDCIAFIKSYAYVRNNTGHGFLSSKVLFNNLMKFYK